MLLEDTIRRVLYLTLTELPRLWRKISVFRIGVDLNIAIRCDSIGWNCFWKWSLASFILVCSSGLELLGILYECSCPDNSQQVR
jgi:hypothetical protein